MKIESLREVSNNFSKVIEGLEKPARWSSPRTARDGRC